MGRMEKKRCKKGSLLSERMEQATKTLLKSIKK